MITQENFIRQNKEVFTNSLDDEIVMMHIKTGKYYVGTRIWEIISKKTQVKDIVDILTEEYEVSKEQCEHDVFTLLEDLRENDLIFIE